MTDREMLEMAAKAAGLHVKVASNSVMGLKVHGNCNWWNPLTDDGDALRLAARLNMDIEINEFFVIVYCPSELDCIRIELEIKEEKMKTARLVITMAAAKAGKEMK